MTDLHGGHLLFFNRGSRVGVDEVGLARVEVPFEERQDDLDEEFHVLARLGARVASTEHMTRSVLSNRRHGRLHVVQELREQAVGETT